MPVWTVFLAWWLLDERPTPGAVLRVLLALAGVTLVLQPAGASLAQLTLPWPASLADVLALMGGFFFAATNVILNRTAHTPAEARVYAMFAGGIVLGGATAATGLATGTLGVTPLPAAAPQWMLLVVLFSMGLAASNVALQYGAARISAHSLSLLMLLEVVFATASSALLGSAQLTAQVLAGGALVMASALLAVLLRH